MRAPESPASWRVEALLEALGTGANGLSEQEAARRLAEAGPNALEPSRSRPYLDALTNQLRSPLAWLLVFAAVVSSLAGEETDAAVIATVLVLGAVVGGVQEFRAGRAIERLKARIALLCEVVRDGVTRRVPAESLVVGDIVLLGAGSLVPADGVLLEARTLQVSEAVLTGETFPTEKTPGPTEPGTPVARRTNAAFLGTSVRSGTGRLLVTATAPDSELGRLAGRLAGRPRETEFDRGLRRFGALLTRIVLVLVTFTFAATVLTHQPPIDSLLFAIALAVGLAPELLPAVVTVTLARGARRMAERGVIVRRLSAIESLGSMDVLCTDKTGTLTRGEVVLSAALDPWGAPSEAVRRLACVNACFEAGVTNALDEALRRAAASSGDTEASLRAAGWEKLDELPYDFVRKRLGVVVRRPDGEVVLVDKGSLAKVLEVSSAVRVGEGEQPLDAASRAAIRERARALGAAGWRTLGVATRRLGAEGARGLESESGLVFEGLLTFADPPKPDAAGLIAELVRMGVDVKMVSGDAREIACHVAREVGIPEGEVLTGADLDGMRDEALWRRAPRVAVFAEIEPNQKERVILALGRGGHVVGYLGDGINDAPALHAADVAISVEGAADVAREAADFVLLRQDLGVLRDGILLGRTTFANTMKYIFTTESANFGNMVSMAAAAAFLPFLPLLAVQVLLNNLLSDVPALALASDEVDPELVQRPEHWDLPTLARFMFSFGLVSSVFDALTFAALYFGLGARDAEFRTGWFVESLLTELAVALVVRTRRPAWRSRPSFGLVVSTVLVAGVAVALPYTPAAPLFQLVPMPPAMLLVLTAITAGYVLAAEAWKQIFFAARPAPAA